jgi:hypothetical protein
VSVSLDVRRLGSLRWIVLNGPAREAVIAVRDDQPIAIPLGVDPHNRSYPILTQPGVPGTASVDLGQ